MSDSKIRAAETVLAQTLGDTRIEILRSPVSGTVWWRIFPVELSSVVVPSRALLEGNPAIDLLPADWQPFPAESPASAVQLHFAGDALPGGFSAGRSMRDSATTARLSFVECRAGFGTDGWAAELEWSVGDGVRVLHTLRATDGGTPVFLCATRLINNGTGPIDLEMISGFCLDGITPFEASDGGGRLKLHRMLGGWSAEGRLLSENFEDLELERSWLGVAVRGIRFGSAGSMPVGRFFPFIAVEDAPAGVCWGAQLEAGSSWQCEVWRKGDNASLSGGPGDREFAHWWKRIPSGGSFETPSARVACVRGSAEALGRRLSAARVPALFTPPEVEAGLPIVFNDWCTHWGCPTGDAVLSTAAAVRNWPVRYYVIDAGWYAGPGASWNDTHGDWLPARSRFPGGLEETARQIRDMGLVPGLWFEFETCGIHSDLFHNASAPLLRLGGRPVTSGSRRFLDFRDKAARAYVEERMCGLIERCEIGYLKADYNETIGIGVDGAESPGEGLRRHIELVQEFYLRLKDRFPGLVVEICASGGHRFEPSFLQRCDVISFSDAHETTNIPIVAADLHRAARPAQSLVWAVLRRTDDRRRLVYSLAAGFLGRLCLSGDAASLDSAQAQTVAEACALYRAQAPVLKDGAGQLLRSIGPRRQSPEGWQAVRRILGHRETLVLHAFADPPAEVVVETDSPDARIAGCFTEEAGTPRMHAGRLVWRPPGPFSAAVVAIDRDA